MFLTLFCFWIFVFSKHINKPIPSVIALTDFVVNYLWKVARGPKRNINILLLWFYVSIRSIMFKTRDPAKANTKHSCLKHLSPAISIELAQILEYSRIVVSLWNLVSPESERQKIIKLLLLLIKQNLKNK